MTFPRKESRMTADQLAEEIIVLSRQDRYKSALALKAAILLHIEAFEESIFKRTRDRAAEIAKANKHVPPFDWDKSLEDKLAIYSNRTCDIIVTNIKSMSLEDL